MTKEIYLDANATTPVLPAARQAALEAMDEFFGNPSSAHATGLRARSLLESVRTRARKLIGAGQGNLMFNSGATEGIQTAVLSALLDLRERLHGARPSGTCLVVGATEHKAVPESLAHWNEVLGLNFAIEVLKVDREGRHDLQQLRQLAPHAGLVCTMAANNETGAVSDLKAIEAVLRDTSSSARWLVDCVQALGKIQLDLASTRIDYAPFSGHKLYAPKGIGMLYVRAGTPFTPLMKGGGQEAGLRSGTENMPGIAALGAVLSALEEGTTFGSLEQLAVLRNRLAGSLREAFPGLVFNMPFDRALPTTLNFSVPGLSSGDLLDLFDAAGVRVSAGSACSAAKAQPSFVLAAMDLPDWQTRAAVRLSFGPIATNADIDAACSRIALCGDILRDSAKPSLSHSDLRLGDSYVEMCSSHSVAPGALFVEPHPLAADEIEAFMRRHPDAMLVDVRTFAEHLVSMRTGSLARVAHRVINIPLGRVTAEFARWLEQPTTPVVFFCRSGNRSAIAATCLGRFGHHDARTITGGLAAAERYFKQECMA